MMELQTSILRVSVGQTGNTALIESWLRNKNTVEFLGVWERLNNPSFNSPEFEGIRNKADLNRFTLSAKGWPRVSTISN